MNLVPVRAKIITSGNTKESKDCRTEEADGPHKHMLRKRRKKTTMKTNIASLLEFATKEEGILHNTFFRFPYISFKITHKRNYHSDKKSFNIKEPDLCIKGPWEYFQTELLFFLKDRTTILIIDRIPSVFTGQWFFGFSLKEPSACFPLQRPHGILPGPVHSTESCLEEKLEDLFIIDLRS